MAGRFSRTSSLFNICIGDEIGMVRIFEYKDLLLLMKEISVYPDNPHTNKIHRTKKLDQLLLVSDKERGPYLVASRL
jgi:hypothetical protein